jgi:hypothetical protein
MKNEPFLPKPTIQPVQLLTESEHAVRSSYSIEIAKLEAAAILGWFAAVAMGITAYLYLESYLLSAFIVGVCVLVSKFGYAKAIASLRAFRAEAMTG